MGDGDNGIVDSSDSVSVVSSVGSTNSRAERARRRAALKPPAEAKQRAIDSRADELRLKADLQRRQLKRTTPGGNDWLTSMRTAASREE